MRVVADLRVDAQQTGLIGRIKAFIRKLDINVNKAYLFGSRSGNDYLKSSDVDLLLVSEGFEGKEFIERMSFVSKKWDLEVPLEALCYTPSEFEKKKKQISIVREAVKTGIPIVF